MISDQGKLWCILDIIYNLHLSSLYGTLDTQLKRNDNWKGELDVHKVDKPHIYLAYECIKRDFHNRVPHTMFWSLLHLGSLDITRNLPIL